jgi:CRISPR-associated protein (TIGR02710 family)
MDESKHTLLVCTVGGSPEPIVATLKRWNPARVRFVPTRETREQIVAEIVPLARSEGLTIDPGRYDVLELPDAQDFGGCLDAMRQLTPIVEEWLARGDQYQTVVDLTGGTKCMSAALALTASRWRCVFSYVGGNERTKEGVGTVISGKEQVLPSHNPWDALGFQAVEEFRSLFDGQAFAAAAALADRTMRKVGEHSRKREFNALKLLGEAYDAWDRFDQKSALSKLKELAKYENDLCAVFGQVKADELRKWTRMNLDCLQRLVDASAPGMLHVADLLANARRRNAEGRLDDAVARLYRAVESLAQVALAERHMIENTKQIPLDRVPEPLRGQWSARSKEGSVFAGLQDAYDLLYALGDEVATRFRKLQLNDRQSPLTARNQSILAHGFERVSDTVFEQLWNVSLQLAQIQEAELTQFPRLIKPQALFP